jgi:predicted RNase H-like nuclease (RuvC/YqgF family)
MKTISTKVSELMESNSELSDELKRVKQENAVLRAMCEKMMAQNPSLANQDAFSHVIL